MKMYKYLTIFLFLSFYNISFPQLSGTVYVGSGQTYTSLTGTGGLFQAINSQGLSGNLTALITSDITESGTNALNQWSGASTVSIQPSAATIRNLTGAVTNAMFRLNGCDNLTIDGRYNGSGKYLRFLNRNGNYPTFSFLNDATYNTITYCTIESNNLSTVTTQAGTILFGSSTGSTGNDNNTLSYCDIRDRSDATAIPRYGIYSYGSAGRTNSDNQILNNNIFNFWRSGGPSAGIYLYLNTGNNWTIQGNSFYQTDTRTSTSNGSTMYGIYVNNTSINGSTISGNYIGGSTSSCGGSALTINGNFTNAFYAINLTVGSTTATSVNNNTISNISLTNQINVSSAIWFLGIRVASGLANIGTSTSNTIGSTTGTGSITLTINGGSYTSYNMGIYHTGRGDIQNNNVGSISISGSTTNAKYLWGIGYYATISSSTSISNNTIGSTLTSNSIQSTSASGIYSIRGIYAEVSSSSISITNNTIANITNISTGTSPSSPSTVYAISNYGSSTPTITGNTIHNLSSASTVNNYIISAGIIGSSTSSNQNISSNIIHSLYSTTTGSANVNSTGLYFGSSSSSAGTISKNRIYNLNNTSSGTTPSIYGLYAYWGSWTVSNNQITITNGEATDNLPENPFTNIPENLQGTNSVTLPLPEHIYFDPSSLNNIKNSLDETSLAKMPEIVPFESKPTSIIQTDNSTNGCQIYGIIDISGNTISYYYNSVYIGGSASSGALNSYGYVRSDYATTVTFRDNIFFNARTGSGSHYAIGNLYSPPSTNWSASASNYNLLVSSNANTIGEWGSGTTRSIDQWRTSSGGDMQSWSTTSGLLSASNLFSSLSSGDLNIQTSNIEAWYVHGKGTPIASINTDYSGNSRSTTTSGGATDIGSNEFTISSTPITATQSGTLGNNQTTTYTFANRTLGSIDWGSSGTVPSAITFLYYSGNNPPNNMPSALYSNAYWSIEATGGLGYSYDITINYDIAVQGTIGMENNIRLAKSGDAGANWVAYLTPGTGPGQYSLNTTNKTITIYGLTSFSIFTLTDASSPLPVELTSFTAFVSNRNVKLNWETAWEINNSGFDIERRKFNNDEYGFWEKVRFVQGKGTTSDPQSYSYTDQKLSTGKYQYRLKQIDFNGNFEYYNLNEPEHIIIGSPMVFDLSQNYPNPSNPKSKIDFQIPFNGKVVLKVYDISGREVANLIDRVLENGYYTVDFDGSSVSSGVYFYRLTAEGEGQTFSKTMKLVMIK